MCPFVSDLRLVCKKEQTDKFETRRCWEDRGVEAQARHLPPSSPTSPPRCHLMMCSCSQDLSGFQFLPKCECPRGGGCLEPSNAGSLGRPAPSWDVGANPPPAPVARGQMVSLYSDSPNTRERRETRKYRSQTDQLGDLDTQVQSELICGRSHRFQTHKTIPKISASIEIDPSLPRVTSVTLTKSQCPEHTPDQLNQCPGVFSKHPR